RRPRGVPGRDSARRRGAGTESAADRSAARRAGRDGRRLELTRRPTGLTPEGGSDVCVVSCTAKKLRLDHFIQHSPAFVGIEAPQTLHLRLSQREPRYLEILGANEVHPVRNIDISDEHRRSPCAITWTCSNPNAGRRPSGLPRDLKAPFGLKRELAGGLPRQG